MNATLSGIWRWLLRFRILHIVYWTYAFMATLHFLQVQRPDAAHAVVNRVDTINGIVFQLLAVYTCLHLLFPRLFLRERYAGFALAALGAVVLAALFCTLVQAAYVPWLMPGHHSVRSGELLVVLLARLYDIGAITTVFIVVHAGYFYYERDRRSRQLESERVRAELTFLRAQLNPHFLFNALNSIYVLMKDDVSAAEEVLLKFSALLRYQLYDCSANDTSLEKEIGFLHNYVALERIRNGDALAVTFAAPDRVPHFPIAPFVLIPFVENAFKHVSRTAAGADRVDILLAVDGGEFRLRVRNTCDGMRPDPAAAGIGLQNVRRRLELLYPNDHRLEIDHSADHHTVALTLWHHDDHLPGGG